MNILIAGIQLEEKSIPYNGFRNIPISKAKVLLGFQNQDYCTSALISFTFSNDSKTGGIICRWYSFDFSQGTVSLGIPWKCYRSLLVSIGAGIPHPGWLAVANAQVCQVAAYFSSHHCQSQPVQSPCICNCVVKDRNKRKLQPLCWTEPGL